MRMSKRAGRITGLKASGAVVGETATAGQSRVSGATLDVDVQTEGGQGARRLLARSNDAGQVFRLVGFYPSMQGGSMRLDVKTARQHGVARSQCSVRCFHFIPCERRFPSGMVSSSSRMPI